MLNHLPTADAEKTINLGLAGFAWVFVLVESLSKRVDVPALKGRLDVCDAQAMAAVISEIEIAVLPYLGGTTTDFQIEEADGTPQREEATPERVVLSEAARSALARCLRKCETSLHQMYQIRRLPKRILRLNGRVFWCIFAVAITASLGAILEYLFADPPTWVEVLATAIPICCAALAIVCAVLRHLKVQSAEENIIDANS